MSNRVKSFTPSCSIKSFLYHQHNGRSAVVLPLSSCGIFSEWQAATHSLHWREELSWELKKAEFDEHGVQEAIHAA